MLPSSISTSTKEIDRFVAHVQDSSDSSKPFHVTNRVKQGCVLAPTLLNLMFSAMFTDAFCDGAVDVGVRYCTDGALSNLRRLKAKTTPEVDTVRDLFFADDCVLYVVLLYVVLLYVVLLYVVLLYVVLLYVVLLYVVLQSDRYLPRQTQNCQSNTNL